MNITQSLPDSKQPSFVDEVQRSMREHRKFGASVHKVRQVKGDFKFWSTGVTVRGKVTRHISK
jgi:hypothetical protein